MYFNTLSLPETISGLDNTLGDFAGLSATYLVSLIPKKDEEDKPHESNRKENKPVQAKWER
jgi:hypothetical protein